MKKMKLEPMVIKDLALLTFMLSSAAYLGEYVTGFLGAAITGYAALAYVGGAVWSWMK